MRQKTYTVHADIEQEFICCSPSADILYICVYFLRGKREISNGDGFYFFSSFKILYLLKQEHYSLFSKDTAIEK